MEYILFFLYRKVPKKAGHKLNNNKVMIFASIIYNSLLNVLLHLPLEVFIESQVP